MKGKDFAKIDELVAKGRIPPSRLPEPGPGEVASFRAALTAKTGMSRAIARQILLQDPRINLTADTITSLKLSKDLGKGKIGSDPLDLMKLLYKPSSMHNYDEFLNTANIRPGMSAKDIATRILAEVELSPNVRYAEGGLAEILQAPRSGMRIGGMGLLTRGLRAALKRTTKGYDKSHADYWDLMDNPSYLLSPVNMQKIKKLEIYRKQLVRDILRNEGRVGKKYNPEMHSLLKIDSNNPKPVATRADLQLLDDYIAQLKNKIKEVGYYGQGAAAEKALVQERNALSNELPFSKFVRDKFLHADGGRAGYAQAGSVGPQRVFPPGTGTKMPLIDPYDEFFLYQNKLMRKKKGLAKILEV
jgi:hypothetical protein